MKKFIMLSLLASVFLLNGCATTNLGEESSHGTDVNKLEGVSIELTKDTYQAEGDSFELVVKNNSDNEVTYGVAYSLEYMNDDAWYIVEPEEEMSFIMIAHILAPAEEAAEELNLTYYEPLAPGTYRIIRQIDGEILTAEFEVEKE